MEFLRFFINKKWNSLTKILDVTSLLTLRRPQLKLQRTSTLKENLYFFSANKSIFLGRKKRQINLTSTLARIQKIFIFPSLAYIQYSNQLASKLQSLKDPVENSLHNMHDKWKSCTSNYLPPCEDFSRFLFSWCLRQAACTTWAAKGSNCPLPTHFQFLVTIFFKSSAIRAKPSIGPWVLTVLGDRKSVV